MPILLILKKLAARLLFPVPLIGLLLLGGLFFCFFGKTGRRVGRWLLFAGVGLFLLFGLTGHWLLLPLVSWYRPLDVTALPAAEYCIVVAGNGISPDETLPGACRFNDSMATRLREAGRIGAELQRRNLGFTIAAAICDPEISEQSKLSALRAFFADYRIAPERILVVGGAFNSRQEVQAFQPLAGKKLLVSEAFHLPRLMVLADRYKLDALPAPAGGREGVFRFDVLTLVPGGENLFRAERAVYEYLGIAEAWLF